MPTRGRDGVGSDPFVEEMIAARRQAEREYMERQRDRMEQSGYVEIPPGSFTRWTSTVNTASISPTEGVRLDVDYYNQIVNGFSKKDSAKAKADRLKAENEKEIKTLTEFMKTGVSRQTYGGDGTIFMVGQDRKPTHILFILDGKSIVAQKDRSKHLKPLLEELAEREGLELKFVKDLPEIHTGSVQLLYFAFKGRKDMDDTDLVTAAKPRKWQGNDNVYESCDECGHCGDPNCNDCSHCEFCQPEDPFWDEDDNEDDWDDED